VLPDLGRQGEADRVTARALDLSGRRGDQLHFGSAIANRRNLLIARADAATAIADQRTFMRIGRELGNATLEYVAEFNLGELHYQEGGDLAAAESHARRSVAIEERHPEVAGRPAGALLLARILAYQGRDAEAGRMLSTIAARIAPGRQEGRTSGEFAPSEQILFEAVALAISGAEAPAWTALEERSARDSVEQEPIEIADLHGLAARRAGRAAEAESSFARALHLAERIPNLIGHRIRRREEGTACPATHRQSA
jgi:hypothetical protein